MSDLPPDQRNPTPPPPGDPPASEPPPPAYQPPPASEPPPEYHPAPGPYPAPQPPGAPPMYRPPPGQNQPPPGYAPGAPGQMPTPIVPMGAAAGIGRRVSLMYQFTGPAGWSILLGLVSIIVPFVLNRVFFFLPIIGLISGIRAIQRGRMIGGIVGIVLNVIGGIITLIGLFGR